jgi:hypothetical protein
MNNMRKKCFKLTGAILIVSAFIIFALGSCSGSSSSGPSIDNEQEITSFLKGKWSTSYYDMGTTWYYRFEITDNKIKYWSRFGEWEWKAEPEGVVNYELTSIMRDTYGAKYRSLFIENTPLALRIGGGLTYRNGCIRFNNSCLQKGWN